MKSEIGIQFDGNRQLKNLVCKKPQKKQIYSHVRKDFFVLDILFSMSFLSNMFLSFISKKDIALFTVEFDSVHSSF